MAGVKTVGHNTNTMTVTIVFMKARRIQTDQVNLDFREESCCLTGVYVGLIEAIYSTCAYVHVRYKPFALFYQWDCVFFFFLWMLQITYLGLKDWIVEKSADGLIFSSPLDDERYLVDRDFIFVDSGSTFRGKENSKATNITTSFLKQS